MFLSYKEDLPCSSGSVLKRKGESVVDLYEFCTDDITGANHLRVIFLILENH
jgi:hypothetical protein